MLFAPFICYGKNLFCNEIKPRCGKRVGETMKMAMKNLTVFWGALLSFMVACSLDETATVLQGTACETQEDCSVNPDTQNPSADSLATGEPSANEPERDSLQNEKLSVDSLVASIDTVIVRDTLVVYKDTVYDTTYSTDSYTSFVYRENKTGVLDTVTRNSRFINCEFNDEAFSCQWVGQVLVNEYSFYRITDSILALYPCGQIVSAIYYACKTDTVYHEAYHKIVSVPVADTSFINYGDTRKTDYIPPDYIYMQGDHPFDSTEMRAFFDTLDVRDPELGGKNHLTVSSELTFKDFPLLVLSLRPMGIKLDYSLSRWPQTYYAVTIGYNFMNESKLQSDTTVTWTLGYTHNEKGIKETDSIQVTTFFKVEKADSLEN
jgi:hypothetical protein